MPRLSHWMIKTALVWLGIGTTIGSLMLLQKGWPVMPIIWVLRLSHIHVLLVGWLLQIVFGVAYWMLPRFNAAGDRGNEQAMWLGYGAINSAVVCVLLHDLLLMVQIDWSSGLLSLAGTGYTVAALVFFWNAWKRVLPFRTTPRNE